jgi:hypothetical protein
MESLLEEERKTEKNTRQGKVCQHIHRPKTRFVNKSIYLGFSSGGVNLILSVLDYN